MAYYFGEEDKEDQQGGVDASKPSGVIQSGQIAPETAAASTATANNARTNPGNFVGISQYLDANKPQTAALANKVGGVITNAADAAQNELKTKAQDTENQIKAGTIGYDASAIDQLNKDASKADVSKIQGMKNATYGGPETLGSIDSLGAAQQAVQNANSEEGRRQLVSNLYQNQPLKKGALTFDNLLLQAAPEAKKTLADAQAKANVGGLEKSIAAEKARLEEAAKNARATTNKTAADTTKAIGDAQRNFETDLQSRVDAKRQAATTEAQAALDRLLGKAPQNTLTGGQDLSLLGINQDQYDRLRQGIQGGYVNPTALGATIRDASGINAANVASAEDYARYNVLKRLAGGGNFLGDDASLAGTYNPDLLDYTFSEPVVPQITTTETTPGTTNNELLIPGGVVDIGIPPQSEPWNEIPLNTDLQATDHTNDLLGVPQVAVPQTVNRDFIGVSNNDQLWNGNKLRTDFENNNYGNFPALGGFSFY